MNGQWGYLFLWLYTCRPGLEAPLVLHAAFDEYAYDLDLSRNVASKQVIRLPCDTQQQQHLTLLGAPDGENIYRSMPVSCCTS